MSDGLTVPTDVRDLWNREDLGRKRHQGEDWYEHGRHVVERLGDMASRITPASTVCEWGGGGGAVLRAMPKCTTYYAVDISEQSLAACSNLGAIAITPEQAEQHIADASVDCVISTCVFQHFPLCEYADGVLRCLRRILRPDGFGMIQTRYFQPGDDCDPTKQADEYAQRYITSAAWQVADFWAQLEAFGFDVVDVVLELEPQYAFYRVVAAAGPK